MNENLVPDSEHLSSAEKEVEKVLRPKEFADFSGQEKVVENLFIFVQAAQQREEAIPFLRRDDGGAVRGVP